MECVFDPKRRLVAARSLAAAKIGTLELDAADCRTFTGKTVRARTIQDDMIVPGCKYLWKTSVYFP
jgi:hypothetical protein